jgi:flap endonuclease-1
MGCKGLWSFLNNVIQNEPLEKLRGKPIIIDVMLYIYKYIIGIRNTGHDILDSNGVNINHIYAMYNLIKNFSENGILPIFVFDGKSPDIKKDIVEKRKHHAEIADEKCKLLETQMQDDNIENNNEFVNEYIKNFKRSFTINTDIINDCKEFLNILGIPYVDSIGEADSQCTSISHYYKNIISGVLSEDSDILIFGGHTLFRDFDFKLKNIKMLEIEKVINYLQNKTDEICKTNFKKKIIFTLENFIDFTIILGNDYGHGIRCSGGNNREKLFELFILNNCNITKFIAHLYQINKFTGYIKYYIPEQFIEKWVLAKNNYKTAEILDPSEIDIFMNLPNLIVLKQYLTSREFTNTQIENFCNIINNLYSDYSIKKFNYDNYSNITEVIDDWTLVNSRKNNKRK